MKYFGKINGDADKFTVLKWLLNIYFSLTETKIFSVYHNKHFIN